MPKFKLFSTRINYQSSGRSAVEATPESPVTQVIGNTLEYMLGWGYVVNVFEWKSSNTCKILGSINQTEKCKTEAQALTLLKHDIFIPLRHGTPWQELRGMVVDVPTPMDGASDA